MFAKLVAFRQNEWVGWWGTIEHWAGGWMAGTGWHAQGLLAQARVSAPRQFWNPDCGQTLNWCLSQPDPRLILSSCLPRTSLQWPNLNRRLLTEFQNSESADSQQLRPEWFVATVSSAAYWHHHFSIWSCLQQPAAVMSLLNVISILSLCIGGVGPTCDCVGYTDYW